MGNNPRMTSGELVTRSPADLDDVVFRGEWSLQQADAAFAAARTAFPPWRKRPVAERVEPAATGAPTNLYELH